MPQEQQQSNSYWDRFELLDQFEDLDNVDLTEESDDDIDMKELEQRATGGNMNEDEYNEDMINDEIEDIDSDDEMAQMAYEQQLNQA